MNAIIIYILNRLSEPSTWAAIGVGIISFSTGLPAGSEQIHTYLQYAATGCAAVAAALKERGIKQ